MRTHVDGHADAPRAARPRAPDARPAPSHIEGDASSASAGFLNAGIVARLQAIAGNRAVSRTIARAVPAVPVARAAPPAARGAPVRTVQRYIGAGDAGSIAGQLHEAMEGWGTDEEAIYGALAGRRAEDIREIKTAYRAAYGTDLLADLRDELTESEYERIRPDLEAPEEGAMTASVRAVDTEFRAAIAVATLHEAMEGLGTEEAEIFNVLTGRTPSEIGEVTAEYLRVYGHSLEEDLRDELSGEDLSRALGLIGRTDSGHVESREREQLVEGIDATVVGEYRYRLTDTRLEIEVPVKFVAAAGCTVQLDAWNAGVAATWNQFAFTEPGGSRVVLNMALANDGSASRTINVIQNANPGTYADPDRANAATFYETLPADTVAHEFGHLFGLADEYQRTAADFEVVTGETAPSRRETSPTGQTAEQIATALNTALTSDPAAGREQAAEQVLVNAGMFTGGVPQQGAFAQEIRRAYDAAYGGAGTDLISTLQGLPNRANWWTTTLFSYASGTIMGNQGKYGLAAHEHPVMPRHLREIQAIVANRWPDKTWSIS